MQLFTRRRVTVCVAQRQFWSHQPCFACDSITTLCLGDYVTEANVNEWTLRVVVGDFRHSLAKIFIFVTDKVFGNLYLQNIGAFFFRSRVVLKSEYTRQLSTFKRVHQLCLLRMF